MPRVSIVRSEFTLLLVALATFSAGAAATLYVVGLVTPAESRARVLDRVGPIEDSPIDSAAVTVVPAAPHTAREAGGASTIPPDSLERLYQELRGRRLLLPVEGITVEDLRDHFSDARGERLHHAIDILAPRDTPVRAVENGRIRRLYLSNGGGGIAIYQLDPTESFAYYYAHLSRYADGLKEGDVVTRGQVIGHVGTTGNAPPDTPHLHFAITLLDADKKWWGGTPLNPFLVLRP